MGLFDYVRCDLPLPECHEWLTEFQSKDLPAYCMATYNITDDGRLLDEEGRLVSDFDGVVDFHGSNITASMGKDLVCVLPGTGSEAVCVEYHCVFLDGHLVKGPVLASKTVNPAAYTDFREWMKAADARAVP